MGEKRGKEGKWREERGVTMREISVNLRGLWGNCGGNMGETSHKCFKKAKFPSESGIGPWNKFEEMSLKNIPKKKKKIN